MLEKTVTATATEMQNHFGRYLEIVMNGGDVIITKNGKEVGRLIPKETAVASLTDALTGLLHGDYDIKTERRARLKEKYAVTDGR